MPNSLVVLLQICIRVWSLMGVVMFVMMVMSMLVMMVMSMLVTRVFTNCCYPELAHLTIHLHLPQLSFNFSLS